MVNAISNIEREEEAPENVTIQQQEPSNVPPEEAYRQGETVVQQENAESVQTFNQLYPKLELLGITSPEQLRNWVLDRRIKDNDSWRKLGEVTGIPHTTLFSNFSSIEKMVKEQIARTPERVAEGAQAHLVAEPSAVSTLQGLPSRLNPSDIGYGTVPLSPGAIANIRAGMTPAQQRIFDYQLRVSSHEANLNRGQSTQGGFNGERPLSQRELLLAAQFQQLMATMNNQNQNRNDGNPNVLKMVMDSQSKLNEFLLKMVTTGKQEPDRLLDFRQGMHEARENIKTGSSNAFDLEINKANLAHNAALASEQTSQVWAKTIQQTAGPIVERFVGGAVAEGGKAIINQMKNAPTNIAKFTCPKCASELSVPIPPGAPSEIPVKCPKCHTITDAKLGTPQQDKPQGQPQSPPKEEESKPKEEPYKSKQIRPTYT